MRRVKVRKEHISFPTCGDLDGPLVQNLSLPSIYPAGSEETGDVKDFVVEQL